MFQHMLLYRRTKQVSQKGKAGNTFERFEWKAFCSPALMQAKRWANTSWMKEWFYAPAVLSRCFAAAQPSLNLGEISNKPNKHCREENYNRRESGGCA